MRRYFNNIGEGISSSVRGLVLTLRHLFQAIKRTNPVKISEDSYFNQQTGIVTLEYPYQSIPVPENGRYRLHNEIDDCIVCDKCAKVCPVNCIDITSIRSTEEIGLTSDGSSKRLYASTFDIDMAKCCFCGLCTTVCPTECLTMTQTFDFSELEVKNMIYHFTDLTPEEAKEKQILLELKQAEKAAAQAGKTTSASSETTNATTSAKPSFKPKLPVPKTENNSEEIQEPINNLAPKPVFKPKMPVVKPPIEPEDLTNNIEQESNGPGNALKTNTDLNINPPVFEAKLTNTTDENSTSSINPKPVFKPKMKPVIPPKKEEGDKNI